MKYQVTTYSHTMDFRLLREAKYAYHELKEAGQSPTLYRITVSRTERYEDAAMEFFPVRTDLDGESEIISVAQAAEKIGVSAERIRQHVKAGHLPAVKQGDSVTSPYTIRVGDLFLIPAKGRPGPKPGWKN